MGKNLATINLKGGKNNMFEQYDCWHCGNPQWVCEAVHFWKPVLKGLAWGVVLALPVAFMLYGLDKLFGGFYQ